MSNPVTRPEGPVVRANSSVGAPQPQPISTHPFAGTRIGKGKQGVRHRPERDVCVLLSSHPDIAAFPAPKQDVGVDLFRRGHPESPY
jgi:hypothetical protein